MGWTQCWILRLDVLLCYDSIHCITQRQPNRSDIKQGRPDLIKFTQAGRPFISLDIRFIINIWNNISIFPEH
jgi:hypothetical protein